MLHAFHVTAIYTLLLLVGTEASVAVFVNPILRRLDAPAQQESVRLFAVVLGRAMPAWYAVGLLVLVAEMLLNRGTGAFWPLLVGALLWLAAILMSVLLLVPINNRLAAGTAADWREQHLAWDRLHRGRVLLLFVASALLVTTVVA